MFKVSGYRSRRIYSGDKEENGGSTERTTKVVPVQQRQQRRERKTAHDEDLTLTFLFVEGITFRGKLLFGERENNIVYEFSLAAAMELEEGQAPDKCQNPQNKLSEFRAGISVFQFASSVDPPLDILPKSALENVWKTGTFWRCKSNTGERMILATWVEQ
ncbi:hypothetical protein BDZ97DRAFT_1759331 [Flammula alnicola]|nr:hypothetical protein BDZ97DRAFT_1759331 [Flammula alnicola]